MGGRPGPQHNLESGSGGGEGDAVEPASVACAQVVAPAPLGVLDYRIPPALEGELYCGVAVRVPLGKRTVTGYVAGVGGGSPPSHVVLKDLLGLDPRQPALPADLMRLLLFAAAHYCVPAGDMLLAMLPVTSRAMTTAFVVTPRGARAIASAKGSEAPAPQRRTAVDLGSTLDGRDDSMVILRRRPAHLRTLLALAQSPSRGVRTTTLAARLQIPRAKVAAYLRALEADGLVAGGQAQQRRRDVVYFERLFEGNGLPGIVAEGEAGDRAGGGAVGPGAHAAPAARRLAPASMALLGRMPVGQAVPLETLRGWDARADARLRRLVAIGLVRLDRRAEPPSLRAPSPAHGLMPPAAAGDTSRLAASEALPTLTVAQADVMAAIERALDAEAFAPFMLHGVTGSGKTEVYLRTIASALARGKTALVLVPEIALTPQLGARFLARFGEKVAIYHSRLGAARRRESWQRIVDGRATIGLGARSALFLPLRGLGAIIVDEEHDQSFKQDETPRYHARDLALWRARDAGAVVVLGSATPALETWANAHRGRYATLRMPARVSARPLPEVEVVDLAHSDKAQDTALTLPLAEALQRTLSRGEQAILFLNRRGFAPYIFCRDCGHSFRCLACDVAMTLHLRRQTLLCHYCGHAVPAPSACSRCQSPRVGAFGLGTERLEQDVTSLFGSVRVARLDADVVRTHADLTRTLHAFGRGDAQLLLGTQMVAKGHDFANVTLVGVIAADASLNFPDFRAAERTFQVLTQVAGRAGRGASLGRVIMQAYETTHYAIQSACAQDYAAFVHHELPIRRELGYPPFGYLAQLRYACALEGRALRVADTQIGHLRGALEVSGLSVEVLGPAMSPLARLKGLWRVQALLKAKSRTALAQALALLPPRPPMAIRRTIDVDPVSML